MTKEEREKAIRKLTEIKHNYERSLILNIDFSVNDSEDELYAFELAIRVLEQEPCEDAISRKELMEWLENIQPMDGKELGVLFDVREHVKKMPPVTPTREHGEWIKVTNGRGGHECSQCGHYAPSYQNGAEHLSDFCTKCGADMRKEQSRW